MQTFESERVPVAQPSPLVADTLRTNERRSPEPVEMRPGPAEAGRITTAGADFAHDLSKVPVKSGPTQAKAPAKGSSERGGFLQTVGSFFSDLVTRPGAAVEQLFGSEDYAPEALRRYLEGMERRGDIEGDYDSDNKARAVVKRWKAATAGFDLSGRQKALLIRELLTGFTSAADQEAILDLLVRAEDGDLRLIFAAVPVADLLGDLDGARAKRLRAWLESHFEGGAEAVRKDKVEPKGGLPKDAPLFPYDWAHFRVKFDGGYRPQEIIEELARHGPAERERAAKDLAAERTRVDAQVTDLTDKLGKAADLGAKAALEREIDALKQKRLRMDVVMEDAFKDIVRTELPTELAAKAVKLTPDQKKAARDALKPPVTPGPGGAPAPFQATLPGEKQTYEDKLRAATPGMIDGYWNVMAKGRQPADHSDPTKMHTLTEMEDLAKVSKDETDDVFGGHYDKGKHPAMKADKPGHRRSLHDLWQDTQSWMTDPSTKFAEKQRVAKALVLYFFESNATTIRPLNRAHHASPRFDPHHKPLNDEAKSQDRVVAEMTTTAPQVRKLNEIDRGWDASASPETREVNIQLFRPQGGVRADQDFMWDMFQTLIHEYIHTLAHARYRTFADSFGPGAASNTLIEGMDSFLDEVVWANIQPRVNDVALRGKVEGLAYAKLPPISVRHASRRRYASFAEAVRLVNVVGYRNVILAYFKGDIEKIGG
jgi:hypothetical protein